MSFLNPAQILLWVMCVLNRPKSHVTATKAEPHGEHVRMRLPRSECGEVSNAPGQMPQGSRDSYLFSPWTTPLNEQVAFQNGSQTTYLAGGPMVKAPAITPYCVCFVEIIRAVLLVKVAGSLITPLDTGKLSVSSSPAN